VDHLAEHPMHSKAVRFHPNLVSVTTTAVLRTLLQNAANRNDADVGNLQATANAVLFLLQSSQMIQSVPSYSVELQNIVRYINEHYQEDLSGHDLQSILYLPNLPCTSVLAKPAVRRMEYLSTLRLNHARHCQLHTEMRMDQIVAACGLHSANYFSLFFKKKVGMSPLQYRHTQHMDYMPEIK